MSQENKKRFIISACFLILLSGLAIFTVKYLLVWLMPFLLGLILASLLQRPINAVLRRTKLRRGLVAPVVTLVMVLVTMGLLTALTIRIVGEASIFAISLPARFQQTAPAVMREFNLRFDTVIAALPPEWEALLRDTVYGLLGAVQGELVRISSTVVGWVANKATLLPGLLVTFIIMLVTTFFLASDYDKIRAFFFRQVPEKYKAMVSDSGGTFARTVSQILGSYLLIMLITFCELCIAFLLMGFEYAVALAVLIALLDIFPVLGTGTALIPWGLIALFMGDVGHGAGLLLTYVLITVLRNILEPRIIGKRIGVHPLATLLLMYLGLNILGLVGLFLFPLAFVFIKRMQEAGFFRLWND